MSPYIGKSGLTITAARLKPVYSLPHPSFNPSQTSASTLVLYTYLIRVSSFQPANFIGGDEVLARALRHFGALREHSAEDEKHRLHI